MRTCHQSRSGSYLDPRRQPLFSIRTISFASGNDRDWRLFKRSAVVNRAQLPAHGYPIALLDPESRPHLARPVISNRQSHSVGSVLISALSAHPLVFRLPGSTWRRANASMMAGLKSPTINRQDRRTRNAITRNPSPNERRPPTLGIGPKPQTARIANSTARVVNNILKNIATPYPANISPSYPRRRSPRPPLRPAS